MSDVQSNVKPLTLTTGRVIFCYCRRLCDAESGIGAVYAVLTRAGARCWRFAGACRCDNPVYAALGAEVYLGAVDRALAASAR